MKETKAIDQQTGQTSIIRFMRSADTRRQNNITFQNRQQDSRRAALPTSSNTVDVDQSPEEPPDKIRDAYAFSFPMLIQVLILTILP